MLSYKNKIIKMIFILAFITNVFSQDVILSLDNGSLNYISSVNIAGFQFDHNGCVENASGGDAASNGFTVSASSSTVLAFSFSGAVIPAGEGTLIELGGTITDDCLSNFVFSGEGGTSLNVQFGDNEEPACTSQVCLELDGGSLNYLSIENIAGFQFSHNGCVESASGGDATSNGFTVSASGTAVLAFSFSGAVIPAGEGTLVELGGTITDDCLSNFVFSGEGGTSLTVGFGGGDEPPPCDDIDNDDICDDIDDCIGEYDDCGICNGDGIPSGNCDCNGNIEDCLGICGGEAVEDECGICNGDGSSCQRRLM